jgi:SAM-dependent methyltransferase
MSGVKRTSGTEEAAGSASLSEAELCPPELLAGQEAAFARDVERLKARRAEFVETPCPACAADDPEPWFEKFSFGYARCRSCGTIYMNPRPSPEVMASYYDASENYRYWAEHIFKASEAVRLEKLHRPRLERILGYCERFAIPRETLLEVGPGFGTFAALAQESGFFKRVVVVERTPEMAAACRERGLDVIEAPLEAVAGRIPPAEVVAAFEVVEHLFAPRDFFTASARLLAPGGLLVVTCPNGEGFDIATLGAESPAVDPEHVNFFNPRSLAQLAEQSGVEPIAVETPGRLDAEFVRDAALAGRIDLSGQPFLKRILMDEWNRLGDPFQRFLAAEGLSSHMWLAARRNR